MSPNQQGNRESGGCQFAAADLASGVRADHADDAVWRNGVSASWPFRKG